MPYIRRTCRAGKVKEIEMYYTTRYHSAEEGRREKKMNPTSEAQKRANRRYAVRKTARRMNANFKPGDPYVTLSYRPEERPDTIGQMKEDLAKFLRMCRREAKKTGNIFRYMWVIERGQKGALHIHALLQGVEMGIIGKLWTKGGAYIQPLWDDGNYRRLAEYFHKYEDKTRLAAGEELTGKVRNCSRNLIDPPEKKSVIHSRDHYPNDIRVPEGYYLDNDSVRRGFHEVTGYSYLYYTLVRRE